MTVADKTIRELSHALDGTEKSRRAGWARSFAAQEKLDESLGELNRARADADLYRKAFSYLYGYINVLVHKIPAFPGGGDGSKVRQYLDAGDVLSDTHHQSAGASAAKVDVQRWESNGEGLERLIQLKRRLRSEKRADQRAVQDAWRSLARQYHLKPGEAREVLRCVRDARRDATPSEATVAGLHISITPTHGEVAS